MSYLVAWRINFIIIEIRSVITLHEGYFSCIHLQMQQENYAIEIRE